MNLPEIITRYEVGTQAVLDVLGDYQNKNLDSKHPEGWSARQVVHHLADSETNSYLRLRRLVGEEDGTLLSGYNEAAWALNPTLGYEVLPIEASLNLFLAVRAASLVTVRRLSEKDLHKTGMHSESGLYTVESWFNSYVAHPFDHAEQIERAFKQQL